MAVITAAQRLTQADQVVDEDVIKLTSGELQINRQLAAQLFMEIEAVVDQVVVANQVVAAAAQPA